MQQLPPLRTRAVLAAEGAATAATGAERTAYMFNTAAHLVLQPDASRLERLLERIGGGEVAHAAQARALRHELVDLRVAQRRWPGELECGSREAEREHGEAIAAEGGARTSTKASNGGVNGGHALVGGCEARSTSVPSERLPKQRLPRV